VSSVAAAESNRFAGLGAAIAIVAMRSSGFSDARDSLVAIGLGWPA